MGTMGIESIAADEAVDLQWHPNSESDLAGYNVYHGTNSGVYGFPDKVQNTTSHQQGEPRTCEKTLFCDHSI